MDTDRGGRPGIGTIAKRLAKVVLTGGALAVASLAPAADQAAADGPWIDYYQVKTITNGRTARSASTPYASSVQIRYGTYQGRQYGWARAVNPQSGYLVLEVDLDGDRVGDTGQMSYLGWNGPTRWTAGYRTSSSSNRAFRACIRPMPSASNCRGVSARTGWW